jgi:WD40 repeat protein
MFNDSRTSDGDSQVVFVSYAETDAEWVEGYLLDALREAGVDFELQTSFAPGVPRLREFERAVANSRHIVLVLSADSSFDGWTQLTELLAATYGVEKRTWPLIPVLREPVQRTGLLGVLIPIDLSDPATRQQETERLCLYLQHPLPGTGERPRCPYPGMAPFREEDHERFFGRGDAIELLLAQLRVRRLDVVIGPSGCGKSSLVHAGLVPALRRSGLFGESDWLVRTFRPAHAPLARLAQALEGDPAQLADTVQKLRSGHGEPCQLLVIVDQFEEVFVHGQHEAPQFSAALDELRRLDGCYLVLTVRADFYAELMGLGAPLWPAIQAHRFELTPLDDAALRRAIVGPAQQAGVQIDRALVERLVAEAAQEPGAMPMVQETLVILWEHLERRYLPLSTYEDLLAHGSQDTTYRTGLELAMEQQAEAALDALETVDRKSIARRVLVGLVQFGEGRADTRRQQTVSQLLRSRDDADEFEMTLTTLVDYRLLTVDASEQANDRRVDLAHESLISGWRTFTRWIEEDRADQRVLRRLTQAAREWSESGGDERLLYREPFLGSAREVADRKPEALSAFDQAFVNASVDRQRQDERRRTRWTIAGVTAAAVLSVAFAVVALVAIAQSREAEAALKDALTQQQVATSRELAASATGQLADDPDLSLLLALEAVLHSPTSEAQDVLRESLLRARLRFSLPGHSGIVTGLAYSPDGQLIATTSADGTARIWDASTGALVMVLDAKSAVAKPQFSPDSKLLMLEEHDSRSVWELTGGTKLFVVPGSGFAQFSPDGTLLLAVLATPSARYQLQAHMWETSTGDELPVSRDLRADPAFSNDSRLVVTTEADGAVHVWAPRSGQDVFVAANEDNPALSGDGKRVATHQDGSVQVWETETGRKLYTLPSVGQSAVFSPDGTRLLTFGLQPELWNATNGDRLRDVNFGGVIAETASFTSDGRFLLLGARALQPLVDLERRIDILESDTGRTVGAISQITALQVNRDGSRILTHQIDGADRIWDVPDGREIAVLRERNNAALSPDGTFIVTVAADELDLPRVSQIQDRTIERAILPGVGTAEFSADSQRVLSTDDSSGDAQLWDAGTGAQLVTYSIRPELIGFSHISPRGTYVVTFMRGRPQVHMWEAPTGRPLAVLDSEIVSVVVSPDDRRVLVGRGGTGEIHDIATGLVTAQITWPGFLRRVTFSPDGTRLLSETGDSRALLEAYVWDVDQGQQLAAVHAVRSAVFSPDGRWLLTTDDSTVASIWDANSGTRVADLHGHSKPLDQAIFSSTELVATVSQDGTAKLWRANGGALIADLRANTAAVAGAEFSSDGKFVLTWSKDGSARVWDTSTAQQLVELRGQVGSVPVGISARLSPDGTRVMTYGLVDGIARIWESGTGKQLAELRSPNGLETAEFSPDGKTVMTVAGDSSARLYKCEVVCAFDDVLNLAATRSKRNLTARERQVYLHESANK